MRLQVFLSHNGVCSRREAMTIIQTGCVRVNGETVQEPSYDVKGDENITVHGRKVEVKHYAYIMLHKPPGYTTTKDDPHALKTILDLLPKNLHHLSPVGRLDRDSEGLLLLTNDGTWAFHLTHPKFHLDKTYVVKAKGKLSETDQKRLMKGITVDNEKTAPCRIEQVSYNGPDTELQITIHEGKKRQIRRMLWAVGHTVYFLKRISIGSLSLGDLSLGKWRELTLEEIERLKRV